MYLCTTPHSRGYHLAAAALRTFLRYCASPTRRCRRRLLVAVAATAASAGVALTPGGDEQAGGLVTKHLRAGPSDQLVVVPLPSPAIGWRAREMSQKQRNVQKICYIDAWCYLDMICSSTCYELNRTPAVYVKGNSTEDMLRIRHRAYDALSCSLTPEYGVYPGSCF